jgi:acetylornithine deacetylase/succinyl-diaminopimelate desuccinylase-like protein
MAYAPTLAWKGLEGPEEAHLVATATGRMAKYAEFLKIPSVSALPGNAGDCRAAAEWLAAELRRIGAERVEVSETGGHPIVVAEKIVNSSLPTVVI